VWLSFVAESAIFGVVVDIFGSQGEAMGYGKQKGLFEAYLLILFRLDMSKNIILVPEISSSRNWPLDKSMVQLFGSITKIILKSLLAWVRNG
jgi:hypothetical protein